MAVYPAKEKYHAEDLIAIVSLLRDPVLGCPWDKVQTHQSIRKNFLEETYEVLEAIDADNAEMLREELGDVLMQVALHSCMEQEKGTFDFTDVCDAVCRKLLYRHPHIFSENAEQFSGLNDWDALKNKEKGRRTLASELDTVPVTLPALMKAQKMQKRAAGHGVGHTDRQKAYAALLQAQDALAQTLESADTAQKDAEILPQGTQHVIQGEAAACIPVSPPVGEEQAGEFLFEAAGWLRCAGLDAEEVLEKAIHRFHAAHSGD